MGEIRATFNDGHSARNRTVRLRLGPNLLVLLDDDGGTVAKWPLARLEIVDRIDDADLVRLTHPDATDARLTVQGTEALATLKAFAPAAFGRRHAQWGGIGWVLGTAAATVALIVMAYLAFPALAGFIADRVPEDWRRKLGAQAEDQLMGLFTDADGEGGFCDGAAGRAALDRLVARLAGPDAGHLVVRVADVDVVNAFALPGGRIVLFRGLIESAESGSEVAGVLAHEMGHVAAGHPLRAMIRRLGISLVMNMVLGSDTMGDLAGVLVAFSYSRDDEQEADAFAVELLRGTGISGDGLAAFFARLAAREAEGGLGSIPAFLSTHPASAARETMIRGTGRSGGQAMSDADWTALKAICEGA